jgi:dTDP-glucose 4,6-dehydratase
MKRVMITGGCGFIGHHVVEHFLRETDWRIDVLDKLTYAAVGLDRVRDINAFDDKRVNFYTADLAGDIPVGVLRELSSINYILHLGAETHVDNSITDPEPFIVSNVLGTMHLLNFARKLDNLEAFCYFSTDEVFGPAPPGIAYKEWDRYDSSNPYAASKAGGEELVLAYATKTVSGSRFYIHCRNIAKAVHFLLDTFTTRDKYNIVGEVEVSNYHLASMIADIIGKPLVYEFVDFHSSRPGHDLRYALDGTKMKNMGWEVPMTFEESLERTIRWTLKPENKNWLMLEK